MHEKTNSQHKMITKNNEFLTRRMKKKEESDVFL